MFFKLKTSMESVKLKIHFTTMILLNQVIKTAKELIKAFKQLFLHDLAVITIQNLQ